MEDVTIVGPIRLDKVNLSKIGAKTLGIWGENDEISEPDINSARLKDVPNSEVCVLPGAGHACYLDKPGEFTDIVLAFIKNIIG